MSPSLLVFSAACTFTTWAIAHAYRRFAFRADILAHPNERSAHEIPTPTGAGISFIIVWSIAVLLDAGGFRHLDPSWLGPVAAAIIGYIDDRRELPVLPRALAYAAACAWSIYWVGFPEINIGGELFSFGHFGLAFGFLSLLWLMNLYNFMDGIDGLAISQAIFVLSGAMLIGGNVEPAGLSLAATCLGFALINWPKAKVFMGDAGSMFLGLLLGVLALSEFAVNVWVWMILLAWFLTDACLTITVRLFRGDPIHRSHNLHAYQHLTRRFGAPKTLYIVLTVNLVWVLPIAYLGHQTPEIAAFLLIFAAIPLLVCQFVCGAGQLEPRLEYFKPRGSREATI